MNAPPATDPGQLRPSRWWYLLAGAVFLVVAVTGIVVVAPRIQEIPYQPVELRMHEPTTVSLQDARLTIYTWNDRGGIRCTATDQHGAAVMLEPPDEPLTISFNNGSGTQDRDWEVAYLTPAPVASGEYTVRCETTDPSNVPSLAVGAYIDAGFRDTTLWLSLGFFCLAPISCWVVAIVVALLRRRDKQRKQQLSSPPIW